MGDLRAISFHYPADPCRREDHSAEVRVLAVGQAVVRVEEQAAEVRFLAVGPAVVRVEEQAAEVLSDYFSAAPLEATLEATLEAV